MKIVLASNNAGKIQEFQALLTNFAVTIIPQAELGIPEIEETGLSFIENAILKARHAAQLSQLPALADDSGLAVSALKGAPGICSARYAGQPTNAENNIKKLLAALQQVPDTKRQASFHCILAFMTSALDPTPLVVEGQWHGIITREARGTNGFGYDPIFYVPEQQKTSAELPTALKNTLSHRAMALQLLLKALPSKL
jgi:XTP/dITP diphosphohydrolase